VREKARRKADRSLVVLDTQSVHAAAGAPAESTGHGRKRVPPRGSEEVFLGRGALAVPAS